MALKIFRISLLTMSIALSFSNSGWAQCTGIPAKECPCQGWSNCPSESLNTQVTCTGTTQCPSYANASGCWIVGTYMCNSGSNWIGIADTHDMGTGVCNGSSCSGTLKQKDKDKRNKEIKPSHPEEMIKEKKLRKDK